MGIAEIPDFDSPTAKVKCPSKLAHVVLRTNNYKTMVTYYKSFLGAEEIYGNDFLSFLSYDDEHHRIAILQIPGTVNKLTGSCGLEHIAFTFDSIADLLLAYRQRKAMGILPLWSVNHGPTTSIYYQDPDGNQIETQVDNYEDPDEATRFMTSKEFAENPIGTDFDPEELINRVKNGEDEKTLKKRVEMGPRGVPAHMV